MAQLKASQVDSYINKPDSSTNLILLYGPDLGLVSERADYLAKFYDAQSSDPITEIRFDMDDIAADAAKLADEAFAISMFSTAKIIRIKGSTRKNILPALNPVISNPLQDCWIIIEGGDLKRESALRKLVEKSPTAMALPCFQDNIAALDQLIREEITNNNLSIDSETSDYLRSLLGNDRRASRNELKKLALFALGQDSVTKDDVRALLGNVSSIANDDIVDAASHGRVDFLETKLDQLLESGGAADMLIWAALRHFQMLHQFRATMDFQRTNAAALVASARPPIHFSRRNSVIKSLQQWTVPKLDSALNRLNTAFYETRSKPALAKSMAATTLLAIALQARQR